MRYSKVLVTGDQGFIGYHVVCRLLQAGVHVIGIDVHSSRPQACGAPLYTHHQGSIEDTALMVALLKKVEAVMHFAGMAEPELYIAKARHAIEINALAGLQLARACVDNGLPLLFASTSEIYGKSAATPFKEDSDRVLGPISVDRWHYATSKALLEHYLAACARQDGTSYIAVRLFNVYGLHLQGRVVSRFIEAGLSGGDLLVHGDGLQTRTFTYIDDAVDAILALWSMPTWGNTAINIGAEDETSILDLAQIIRRLCGGRSRIRHISYQNAFPFRHEDMRRRRPDLLRLYSLIGRRTWLPLPEGLARMIATARTQTARPA